MRAAPAFALAASLAFAMPMVALCQPAAAIVDIGFPKPYAFNEARIFSRSGISGLARLYGTGVDGERALLFEARVTWVDELVATWYYAPALVSLSFEGFDGDGRAAMSTVRMMAPGSGTATGDDAVAGLSRLGFPFRQTQLGEPRRSVALAPLGAAGRGADPESAARTALDELFLSGRQAAPLALLAAWAAVVIAATPWLAAAGHRKKGIVVAVCAMAAFGGLAYFLGAGPAELYRVNVPTASQGVGAQGTDMPMTVADHGAWRSVSWGTEAGLSFVAVRSPIAAAVPVSAFAGCRLIRFARTPLVVVAPDGRAMLAPSRLALAWTLHDQAF